MWQWGYHGLVERNSEMHGNFVCSVCGEMVDEEVFTIYHCWKTGIIYRNSLYDFCSIVCLRKWINTLSMDKGLELIPRVTWEKEEKCQST